MAYKRGQRGRGLSPPPTFWDLLNRSFFQIAQKCNKKLHEKKVPLWAPSLFRWLRRPSQIVKSNILPVSCPLCYTIWCHKNLHKWIESLGSWLGEKSALSRSTQFELKSLPDHGHLGFRTIKTKEVAWLIQEFSETHISNLTLSILRDWNAG